MNKIIVAIVVILLAFLFLYPYIREAVYEHQENVDYSKRDTDLDGLSDAQEMDLGTNRFNIDTDGDYVRDDIELEKGTDPLKIFTFGEIDDFNRIYTYDLIPYDSNVDEEFMNDLPNVEARLWDHDDGKVGVYLTETYLKISIRDPLIKYLANTGEIRWDNGNDEGTLFVNGEEIFGYYENPKHPPRQASYFFTHGRTGKCGEANRATMAILELMGYKTLSVVVKIHHDDGTTDGHVVPETVIDGKPYIVKFSHIIPRDNFYEENHWEIVNSDYDPDWYKK